MQPASRAGSGKGAFDVCRRPGVRLERPTSGPAGYRRSTAISGRTSSTTRPAPRSWPGGTYVAAPGTEGPDVAWWCYEDHRYSVKRLIAAAGYPADDISLAGITFEQMRPGCWKQDDRLADMDVNGMQAQLCYPNYPRFAGQLFLRGDDRELALLCVRTYVRTYVQRLNGRGVVRHSRQAAAEQFGSLPDAQIFKLARGNAINLLGLALS